MGRSIEQDPLKVYDFTFEAPGFDRFGTSDITGLKSTTESVEYDEGGDNRTPKKSAGRTNYGAITIKRGQIIDPGDIGNGALDYYTWRQQVHSLRNSGNTDRSYRRDVTIIQHNAAGVAVAHWDVTNAWPSDYVPLSDLSGKTSENSFEELVLEHEGFDLREANINPPGRGQSINPQLGIGL